MKQAKLFSEPEPTILTKLEVAQAQILAKQIENIIKPLCNKLEVVGSIRRQKPIVGDIDFVAVAADNDWTKIANTSKKSTLICSGKNVVKLICPFDNSLFQVDFYRATQETFGIQEVIRTGSADHNMWLAGYAQSKGFRLKYSEGLKKEEVAVAGETEESVFTALGLQFPQPQFREVADGKPVWTRN